MTPRKGYRFLHSTFFDSRYSIAEYRTLPRQETAQEFIVTKVARGCVYYRPVYRHSGEQTNLGSPFVESVEKFETRVLCDADENGKAVTSCK